MRFVNKAKNFVTILLLLVATVGFSMSSVGCSKSENSSEPDSGPPPDLDPMEGMEMPHT